jgi:hypothetical protein
MNLFYLHGFASSPGTTKGQFFAGKLAELGFTLHIPDLNAGDFGRLTLTRMIDVVRREIGALAPDPVYVIGSSMGAAVALHFLDRYREAEGASVAKMLFLAPAFDFLANREQDLGAETMAQWRQRGEMIVYHYGYQKEVPLRYDLIRDLQKYDSYQTRTFGVPILIYHGRYDDVISYQQSLRFARGRENVEVQIVASDHLLHDQLECIWADGVAFFGLVRE